MSTSIVPLMTTEQPPEQVDAMAADLASWSDGKSLPIARSWSLRTRRLNFQVGPALMGIVNVTPDSFSDGGQFFSTQSAIDHALRLEDAGADLLDIGGESTRPYSQPIDAEQELRRVLPVIESLSSRVSIPISIDTSKACVAKAAIDRGAEIVNDVSGLEGDALMSQVVAKSGVGVCVMHCQGKPMNMQDNPFYLDVVQEVLHYLQQRIAYLCSQGISEEKLCVDPGIGFGKTHENNIQLLRNAAEFLSLGRPVLVGHSRKGFIGKMIGNKDRSRDSGTVGISLAMAMKGIQVIRVHDVASTREALTCFQACMDRTDSIHDK